MRATAADQALVARFRRDPSRVTDAVEVMRGVQAEVGNLYAGAPIRSTPHALLVDPARAKVLARQVEGLGRVLERAARKLIEAGKVGELLGKSDLHTQLIEASLPRTGLIAPIMRIDGMVGRGTRFRVIEVNTDGSTGLHDAPSLAAAALATAPLSSLGKTWALEGRDLYDGLAEAMRGAHQARGGEGAPRVAVCDWAEVKTGHEQEAVARALSARGVPACRVDPRQLKRVRGTLRGPEGRVDLVYKRVLTAELLARRDEVRDYLEAALADQVGQVDPFAADVPYDKGLLALLREGSLDHLLTKAQRDLARAVIPEASLYRGGARQRARAVARRERLVLKPRTEYGGRGVVLGPFTGARAWARALDRAAEEGGHMLQAFCPPPVRNLWVPTEAGGERQALFTITGVWVMHGKMRGLYERAGPSPVINVSGGAFGIPVLWARRRR